MISCPCQHFPYPPGGNYFPLIFAKGFWVQLGSWTLGEYKKKAQQPALLVGGIGHEGNISGPLDGPGYLPLMPGTVARYPPRQQFTPLAYKTPQAPNIFIIYILYLVYTKATYLAFSTTIPCHISYHPSFGRLKG